MLEQPLFEGQRVRLAPLNYEKDAELESRWTHDTVFMRLMYTEPAVPRSPWHLKKTYEELDKTVSEKHERVHFRIQVKDPEQVIGLADIYDISWSNQTADLRLGIAEPSFRRGGYGSETLSLLLRYAFSEMNLYRLTAAIPAYNAGAMALAEKFGFVREVRHRQSLYRDGRRWDLFLYGLLADEWRAA